LPQLIHDRHPQRTTYVQQLIGGRRETRGHESFERGLVTRPHGQHDARRTACRNAAKSASGSSLISRSIHFALRPQKYGKQT
jgi:hypothetical protein